MDWQMKMYAISTLAGGFNTYLMMRKPGDWYLHVGSVEIKKGGCLARFTSSSASPEKAVDAAWESMTKLPPEQYLVVESYTDKRRAVRWNGFMWEDVQENK